MFQKPMLMNKMLDLLMVLDNMLVILTVLNHRVHVKIKILLRSLFFVRCMNRRKTKHDFLTYSLFLLNHFFK